MATKYGHHIEVDTSGLCIRMWVPTSSAGRVNRIFTDNYHLPPEKIEVEGDRTKFTFTSGVDIETFMRHLTAGTPDDYR
jgi:hypothetical protein